MGPDNAESGCDLGAAALDDFERVPNSFACSFDFKIPGTSESCRGFRFPGRAGIHEAFRAYPGEQMTDPGGQDPRPQNSEPLPRRLTAALAPAPHWTVDLRHLLAIAGANVASTLAQTVMSLVDFWIVSKLPDASAAQAAVTSGSLIFLTIFGFQLGAMTCTTTVVSQSLGAGRRRDCSSYAWQGVWLSLMFGLLGFALWPVMPQFFGLFGHDALVTTFETGYTQIRLLSLGAAGITVALGHYFIGIHRPWPNTYSAIASNVVNAVLAYGLVFGKWGLPAMGVPGAALGTVIATVFRMAWLFWSLLYSTGVQEFESRRTWRWNSDKVRRLLYVGWPSGTWMVLEIGAWATFQVAVIGMFGRDPMAATAAVWRYTELSFMPAVGIGIAIATMVGRSIGENRRDLAYRRARMGVVLNAVYMGTLGVCFVLFRRPLIEVFSHDPNVIELATWMMIFAAVFQVFDAFTISYQNALRGAGDTRWPAVVGACLAWGIMIGCGWFVGRVRPDWGPYGPWTCATLYVVFVGTSFRIRWRQGEWEKLDIIGRGGPIVSELAVVPTDSGIGEAVVTAETTSGR